MSTSLTTTTGGLIGVRISERHGDEDDTHLNQADELWLIQSLEDSIMFIDTPLDSLIWMEFLRPSSDREIVDAGSLHSNFKGSSNQHRFAPSEF